MAVLQKVTWDALIDYLQTLMLDEEECLRHLAMDVVASISSIPVEHKGFSRRY